MLNGYNKKLPKLLFYTHKSVRYQSSFNFKSIFAYFYLRKCFACMCVYITCVQCLQKASDRHWSYSHELRRPVRDGNQIGSSIADQCP